MIEINLVPDVKQQLIRAQQIRSAVVSIAIVVAIAAVGVVVLLLLYVGGQELRRSSLDNSIKTLSAEFEQTDDIERVLTIQRQLEVISNLNDSKLVSSRLFDVLSAITNQGAVDVAISSLLLDEEAGTITINAQSESGYATLEQFEKTIKGSLLTYREEEGDSAEPQSITITNEVTTTDPSFGEDAEGRRVLRFTVSFEYPEQLFSNTVRDVAVSTPGRANVTDSFVGLPQSLFAQRAEDIQE